jgi:recombination protein RecT
MTTALQKNAPQTDTLEAMFQRAAPDFAKLAPAYLDVGRMLRIALNARAKTPALAQCSKQSFIAAMMQCSEMGLEPIGAGGAHLVPFRNKKTDELEVTVIPDWRGLISLAKRTGQIKHAYAKIIYKGDFVDYEEGDTPKLIHKPDLESNGEAVAAYCVVILPDDTHTIELMRGSEIDGIKSRSKAKESGPWVTDELEMWKKTVVKRALKPFASSPQMQTAISLDNEAVGLIDLHAKPVAMPEALPPAPTQAALPPKPTKSEKVDEKEEAPETGANVLIGTIESVTAIKTGKNAKGKWTLHSIKIATADGIEQLSTFGTDGEAEAAQVAADEQRTVRVEFELSEDGRYKNLTKIEAINE